MKTERRLSSEEDGLKGARELAVCLGDAKRGVPCSHAQEGPCQARPAHAHQARDPESGPVTQGREHSRLPTKTTALQSQHRCSSPPSLPPPLHTHVLHTRTYVQPSIHPALVLPCLWGLCSLWVGPDDVLDVQEWDLVC